MTWQELPIWAKIRMLINQKIQSNIIDPSVFIDNVQASKFMGGFEWLESQEGGDYWFNILEKNRIPKETAKLYIYESTPGKYDLKMSHSDTYLYFTKQELSDLGLTNPIIEPKGSCKYHTFEEHLNSKSVSETNPECLAFKEWALKEESAIPGKSLWDVFVQNAEHWMNLPFNERHWMEECNERCTGYYILISFTAKSLHTYWKEVYKLFRSQKKSPAEIFIEWALKQPYNNPKYYSSIADWYLRVCHGNITKEAFIERYKNSSLDTIYLNGFNKKFITKDWADHIKINWQKYLNTLNNENQLQRKEIPVTGSTGESRSGVYLGGGLFEPSRGHRVDQKGCEIFGEEISVSKAGLSFGHNCSLSM